MKALLTALALLALAGLGWLIWGDDFRPHEPVRLLEQPRPGAAGPGQPGAATGALGKAPTTLGAASATPDSSSAAVPQASPPLASAQPLAQPAVTPNAANSAAQDPLQAFRRAVEEANARRPTSGSNTPPIHYDSLPQAIEAARRAQLQASAPPPEPAPGAGINPFTR